MTETGIAVRGLDAIDGTPVLDLKPYYPVYGRTHAGEAVDHGTGPGVMLSGLQLSLVAGLLGGLLPARGAAQGEIVEAMRRV